MSITLDLISQYILTNNYTVNLGSDSGRAWYLAIQEAKDENARLREALELVRDADDARKKNGYLHGYLRLTPYARAKIDAALKGKP